jgi:Reverse transcriptase (RNA-dependent DNA polymerase)
MVKLKDVKTRIVEGGDHQEYGVNYPDTMHQLLSGRSCDYFYICRVVSPPKKLQVDVKIAFLIGELEEEVYVRTPRGIAGWPSRIKRLLKTMYGLKQAHNAWHAKISGDHIQKGFSEFRSVSCVFINWFGTGGFE